MQPNWKLVAQLGDKNPIEYGGYFIYEDTTGVYPPEGELLISPEDDSGKWEIRRFILEPCTFIDGILSDNKYHPNHPAWFARDLKSVADFGGMAIDQLVLDLIGDEIHAKAQAWRLIGEYHGFDNLDSYPLYFKRSEVEARYKEELLQAE